MMAAKLRSANATTVEETLGELLSQDESGSSEVCEGLLCALQNHPQLAAKVAEVIASFAREDGFRDVAVACAVVPGLCPLLASGDKTVQLHTLRAIGNLCFDHDGNRELVLSSGGCPLLVKQLTSCASLSAEREYDRLKCVACGCLFNTVNENEMLCEKVLKLEAIRPLCSLLATPGENSSTVSMGLKTLYVLLAAGRGHPTLLPPPALSTTFSHLLTRCVTGDLADVTLALLETVEVAISVNDSVHSAMVEAGCVKNLVQIVDPSLQMKAINLLVLLCANDSSLKLLAEDSALITAAEQWLTDLTSLERQANAALLFANMARTDRMCDMLIARGLVSHLIHLTQIPEPEELSGKVHVSALSALRNLCLPAAHKPVLLEKGVLEAALTCLQESKWPHVHFKCLGIARLLVIQQENVCEQLSQPDTLTLVCEQCSSAEHSHVAIEGSRLLASLVKHCKSEEVMRRVVSGGGVKLIAALLESEHVLLRNEALVALNLLAVLGEGEGGEEATAPLTEEVVMSGVCGVVASDESSPELLTNALNFLVQLAQSHTAVNVKQRLQALVGFAERLEALSGHSSKDISDKAQRLTALFDGS